MFVVAVKRGVGAEGREVPERGRALNAKVRVRAVVLWLESTGVLSTRGAAPVPNGRLHCRLLSS